MSGQLLDPPAPPTQHKTLFDPRTILFGLTGYAIKVTETGARLVKLNENGKDTIAEITADQLEILSYSLHDAIGATR